MGLKGFAVKRIIYVAIVAIGFGWGLIGYAAHYGVTPDKWGGILLGALHLFIPRPTIAVGEEYNVILRSAAVVSGVSGFIAVGLFWMAVAGRTVAGLWTQLTRRDHILIVGEGAFAERFFRILRKAGKPAILATPQEIDPETDRYAAYRLKVAPTPEALDARFGLRRCKQVVVDRGGDGESLATAVELIKFGEADEKMQTDLLATRVADPILGDRFFDVVAPLRSKEKPTLSVFDENLVLARHALRADPPFMRAAARDQDRVHALIVGFGDLGEKLLEQVMLTSMARDLKVPRITILDREKEPRKDAFCARSPRTLCDLPIEFFGLDVGSDALECPERGPVLEELAALEKREPFTVIYLALPTRADNLKAALLMDRARERDGVFCAPISYRLRVGEEKGDFLQRATPSLPDDRGFVPMSIPAGDMIDAVLGMSKVEASAKRIHEAYVARNEASDAANKPWSALPDTYKRSNRRIMDHLPAKLWTVGVRPELPLTDAEKATLKDLVEAPTDDPNLMKLARIEHERWCIDRKLDGWTFAEERNDTLRHHNRLVPFEELHKFPGEVEKDIEQVKELLRIVLEING